MTWQTADLPGIADRCFLGYKRCLLSYILEMTVSLASLLMTDRCRILVGGQPGFCIPTGAFTCARLPD